MFYEKTDMPLACVPEDLQGTYHGCYTAQPIPSEGLEMTAKIRRCTDNSCPPSEELSVSFVAGQDPIDIVVP